MSIAVQTGTPPKLGRDGTPQTHSKQIRLLSGDSFGGCVMVVAHYAGDLPCAVFVLPQVNEFAFAHAFGVFVAGMVEAVIADFESAIALHVVDVQAAGNEFAGDAAADVFLDALGQGRLAQSHAALVVIELDVVINEWRELDEVALVVGVEERSVESGDGAVEVLLVLNLVERENAL